eukprot:2066119-Rhodomonas_salina.1
MPTLRGARAGGAVGAGVAGCQLRRQLSAHRTQRRRHACEFARRPAMTTMMTLRERMRLTLRKKMVSERGRRAVGGGGARV